MKPYEDLTYRGQLGRLRVLALKALDHFPLHVQRVTAIQHGENATFCVDADEGRHLLRVHRTNYNSPAGVGVELSWLQAIARDTSIVAPRPVAARDGSMVLQVSDPGVPHTRSVVLFEWVHGHFRFRSLTAGHLEALGRLTAELHGATDAVSATDLSHRPRWDADGLVGDTPIWGAIGELNGVAAEDRTVICDARERVLDELKSAERAAARMGLIHADLHHGNYLFDGRDPRPIDFDDCGYGFLMYDLAVTSGALTLHPRCDELRASLLAGYESLRALSDEDRGLFRTLHAARRIALTGWLASRSDNPSLRAHLPKSSKRHAQALREYLSNG